MRNLSCESRYQINFLPCPADCPNRLRSDSPVAPRTAMSPVRWGGLRDAKPEAIYATMRVGMLLGMLARLIDHARGHGHGAAVAMVAAMAMAVWAMVATMLVTTVGRNKGNHRDG